MPELRISLSEEAHKKLHILRMIKRKTISEIIEELIMKVPLPKLEFVIAGEDKIEKDKVDYEKISPEELDRKEIRIEEVEE